MRANTIPPFATFKIFATCRWRRRPLTYRTVDETACGWHGTVMTEVVIETDQLSLRQARERVCSSVKPSATDELQVVETILRSAGYDVVTYLGGDQLEEKLVKSQPDVVLQVPRKSILPRPYCHYLIAPTVKPEMKRSRKRL